MGIDLSLRLTPHPDPRACEPADRLVAWARGFVPIAWWLLFAPGDAVKGPQGLAMITPAEAALDRLLRRAPQLRAAAGRHALGLRSIEVALRGAPSMFLRAELHELYDMSMPGDLASLCEPVQLEVWPSQLELGRIVATRAHGGTLADAVVGVVPEWTVALPDPATLDARSLAALRSGDPCELDLLEEALARPLEGPLAPWLAMTRRQWGDGRADAAAAAVLTALVEGRAEPFAPLARTRAHFAAYALAHAADRAYERRGALRRALRGATEPLAAALALTVNVACPSRDALVMAEWLDGGPPPRTVASREAVLACRLASVGAPAWPLSLHDPVAVVERAIGWREVMFHGSLAALGDAPELAVARGLGLSAEAARSWVLEDTGDDTLVVAARSAAEVLCSCALTIDGPTRAALRDRPAPDAPFLAGVDRACVRLALGELAVLPALLADDATSATALVAALRSAGASERALGWLVDRARGGDLAAAALVLDTPGTDDTALAVARSMAAPALRRIVEIGDRYAEGLITNAERDGLLAEIVALARALGPDGAPLLAALGD